MPPEEALDPDLFQVGTENQDGAASEFPEITLENLSTALLVLGFIMFLINAFMVYLYMTQVWPMRYPLLTFAEIGVAMILFGGCLHIVNRFLKKKNIL